MTVSSVVVRAVAGWTGAETEFPTGIQVLAKSQLVVSLVPDEGARLPLTLGLHYAVNLSPAGVATVVPLPAFPAVHGEVSFVRRTPMTQDYDPTATDTYDAAGHAAALDRSAMRVAELSQAVDDIAAASVVVEGGAASVPAGAVYVSDGAGRAIAGPTAVEINQAEAWAGEAKQSAKAAADSANAAALFDPSSYSTTAQIATMLDDYVPAVRKVRTGSAFLLNGVAGTDAAPAEADLTANLLFKMIFADLPDTIAGERDDVPVHPAGLKAAMSAQAAPSGHIYTHIDLINVSGDYTVPADLDPSVTPFVMVFGAGGGRVSSPGTSGGLTMGEMALTPGAIMPATIGASVLTGTAGSTTFGGWSATGGPANGGSGTVTGSGGLYNGYATDFAGQNFGNSSGATALWSGRAVRMFWATVLAVKPSTMIAFSPNQLMYWNYTDAIAGFASPTAWGSAIGHKVVAPGSPAISTNNYYGSSGAVLIFHRRKAS